MADEPDEMWIAARFQLLAPRPSQSWRYDCSLAMRAFAVVAFWLLVALQCSAEPRWCAVSQKDPSNSLLYPPIARAAGIQGVVVMRMIYEPKGRVQRTEPVFGPALLAASVAKQLLTWTVKTDAKGDQECVTLLIAEFRFHGPDEPSRLQPQGPVAPGIVRVSVDSEVLIISDPAGTISNGNAFKVFAFKLKRIARKLLHRSG